MKKTLILMALLVFSVAGTAHAKKRPYGISGCGLGSQVFKDAEGTASHVLAATTNGTFYSQLFGITSGTSNCTDNGVVASHSQIPHFVEANQTALAKDIARGNGETLANLSKVMGCPDSEVLGKALQKNYGQIFSTENIKSANITGSILRTVKEDSSLAMTCRQII